ncbi:MAG: hypothetical protein WCO66_03230 [Candidatus Absconditabacteria bacterium]
MTDLVLLYICFGVFALLVIFCFAMGIEKMIKLLLGNYLLMLLAFSANQSLVLLSNFLQKTPTLVFAGFSYANISQFISNGKMTFVFILYALFAALIYYKSKIRIVLPMDDIVQKILYIVLVPFTAVGIIFALLIVFFGITIFDPVALSQLLVGLPQNPILFAIVSWFPFWLFLHALFTILITSEVKIQIRTGE